MLEQGANRCPRSRRQRQHVIQEDVSYVVVRILLKTAQIGEARPPEFAKHSATSRSGDGTTSAAFVAADAKSVSEVRPPEIAVQGLGVYFRARTTEKWAALSCHRFLLQLEHLVS